MIIQGNSFRLPLADNSVHCAISSYPYFNLRTYDLPPLIFGGSENCQHEWSNIIRNVQNNNGLQGSTLTSGASLKKRKEWHDGKSGTVESAACSLCGAFYGSFGLEPNISLHVRNAVLVSREVKRVLHPTGVFWLNYGDSYSTARNGRRAADGKALGNDDRTFRDKPFTVDEIPAKNLCLIPERIVIALQDDGWIVRSKPPWIKTNPMPESIDDRPGTAHEYVFMLVKSKRNYFDMEAVRRPKAESTTGDPRTNGNGHRRERGFPGSASNGGTNLGGPEGGRALRTSDFFFDSLDAYIAHLQDIRDNGGLMLEADGSPAAFVVNPKGYKYAHYATFPLDLITPMIKCSTSERGCCPKCSAPWIRVVEKGERVATDGRKTWGHEKISGSKLVKSDEVWNRNQPMLRSMAYESQTIGWRPSCDCIRKATPNYGMQGGELLELADEIAEEFKPVPAIVLDPFVGSGTTVLAAQQLGRRGIGVDLNPTYLLENALPRTAKKGGRSLEDLPLFALQETI